MEILRETYQAYMTGQRVDRPIFVELFGPLVGLEDEWRAQGASEAEIDLTAFGFDRVRRVAVAAHTRLMGGESTLLEQTAEHEIHRDRYGRRMRLMKGKATIPLPMDYPVQTMDDWLAIKPRYVFDESRVSADGMRQVKIERDQGAWTVAGIPGAFDEPRQLMGEENLCLAFYDQPEMVHDMLATFRDTALAVLERVTDVVPVDQLSIHEDLAGKSGSLVGPDQIEQFFKPYLLPVWELLRSRGSTLFQQDSDGNINRVIDAFMACGINCMYPMEPAAGMDVVQLRAKYGRSLAMLGGIDKHVLRQGEAAIRAELEYKLQPAMLTGGWVPGLDHRIPNGTPLEAYRFYVRTAREMLGLPPNPEPGWARMAF